MRKTTGFGDIVHWVLKKLGILRIIRECGGCKRRREVLNKFRVPRLKL